MQRLRTMVHDMDQLLLLSRINGDAPRANDGGGVCR